MKLRFVGQDESIPGISIECAKCKLWEKEIGSVATGCKCEPDYLKVGGAAVVVGGLIWYLTRGVGLRSNPPMRLFPLSGSKLSDFNTYADQVEDEYRQIGGRHLQPYKVQEFYSLGVPPKEAARAIKTRRGPAEQRRREAFG